MTVLVAQDLHVRFETPDGYLHAVNGVDLKLRQGETVGLVGESGSGKSVTSLALMGLVPKPAGKTTAARLEMAGQDLRSAKERTWRKLRGKEIAMIFQDPMTSLNPFLTIGQQMSEAIRVHLRMGRKELRKRCAQGLDEVGIAEPERRLRSYPHELSGGMRQRVMIAMALLCRPKLLLADEPTTALDVTIQAQILELLEDCQEKHGMAMLMVTHDLGVVAQHSDRVLVMYAGKLVEEAPTRELFSRPAHPYTRGLLASVPRLTGDPDRNLAAIPGGPPDLGLAVQGCAFEPRCGYARTGCLEKAPSLEPCALDRQSACFESGAVLAGQLPTRSDRGAQDPLEEVAG